MIPTLIGDVLSLDELISLDEKDDAIYQQIKSAPPLQRFKDLLTNEKALNEDWVVSLIKIGLVDNDMATQMKEFRAFWDSAWRYLGKTLYGIDYPILPQLDSYALITGKFLYVEYQTLLLELEAPIAIDAIRQLQQKSYLWFAATDFHYYEAIDVLCWEMVDNPENSVDDIISLASQAAQYYLAPGFALLAKIANSCGRRLAAHQTHEKSLCYATGYVATEKTEKILPISADHINVAYHFNTFHSANRYIRSFDEAKNIIFDNMMNVLSHNQSSHPFFVDKKETMAHKIMTAKAYIDATYGKEEGEHDLAIESKRYSLNLACFNRLTTTQIVTKPRMA